MTRIIDYLACPIKSVRYRRMLDLLKLRPYHAQDLSAVLHVSVSCALRYVRCAHECGLFRVVGWHRGDYSATGAGKRGPCQAVYAHAEVTTVTEDVPRPTPTKNDLRVRANLARRKAAARAAC